MLSPWSSESGSSAQPRQNPQLIIPTLYRNKNYAHVMVSRFFLGVFESSVTPGLSLMTGFWYTRDEIPLRQTIWYSAIGWGGMIGALMAAGIQGYVGESASRSVFASLAC